MIKVYGATAPRAELVGLIRDLRPVWLLEELGQKYERIALDPTEGQTQSVDYLKINPLGKIPTLTDGEFVIFESAAICEYLAEKFERLVPKFGSAEYYHARQWNYWFVSNIEPHASRVFACDKIFEKNATTDHMRKLACDVLDRFLSFLEKHFSENEYMLKMGFSNTDIIFGSGLVHLKKTELVSTRPSLNAYLERLYQRAAFKKAYALNGRTAI